ncbi:MAG: PadR family transcriptional regulator [Sphingomonas sp.]
MTRNRALSESARIVLALLAEAGEERRHGYELARLAGIKSGTLYPLLIRLEARGYLDAEWQAAAPGQPPRHAYRLTPEGIRLARENPPQAAPSGRAPMQPARS